MSKNDNRFSPEELPQYRKNYSEDAFWDKLRRIAAKAGSKVVYNSLVLYYTLADPSTPTRYKAVIAGALGYFILPLDLVPDFLPFAGLADDWSALVAAIAYVCTSIKPENREKAREKTEKLMPSYFTRSGKA